MASGSMGRVMRQGMLPCRGVSLSRSSTIDSYQQVDALPRFKREAELASSIGHEKSSRSWTSTVPRMRVVHRDGAPRGRELGA